MKIAQIDRLLFWHALSQQDSASRNRWLGRWLFADDAVRLSMQPAPSETTGSNLANASDVPEHEVLSTETLPAAMKADQKGSLGA
jgi:hypothetical protein